MVTPRDVVELLLHGDACGAELLVEYCSLVLAFNLDGFLSEIGGGPWVDSYVPTM